MKKELDNLNIKEFKSEGLRIEFTQNFIIYSLLSINK